MQTIRFGTKQVTQLFRNYSHSKETAGILIGHNNHVVGFSLESLIHIVETVVDFKTLMTNLIKIRYF